MNSDWRSDHFNLPPNPTAPIKRRWLRWLALLAIPILGIGGVGIADQSGFIDVSALYQQLTAKAKTVVAAASFNQFTVQQNQIASAPNPPTTQLLDITEAPDDPIPKPLPAPQALRAESI
jgi:hypothetical protein